MGIPPAAAITVISRLVAGNPHRIEPHIDPGLIGIDSPVLGRDAIQALTLFTGEISND